LVAFVACTGFAWIKQGEDMGKLRIIVLIVSIMPLVLNFVIYLLSKNERFLKTFFGDDAVNQKVWLPWLLITLGWFLFSVVVSLVFDL
jgi:hypothetical protein